MQTRQRGLWHHADFLKLLTGQTISQFGSGISGNALPLIAVLTLGAGSAQMGVLMAAIAAPAAVVGLFAGVWVDRWPRRPILIWSDLGRALLVASIPAAAFLGRLSLAQLYVVATLTGILTIVFEVAYQAFVPDLVRRDRVVEANSRLATSAALQEIVTPGLTGVLETIMRPPLTLVLDACSFLCSAASLALLRTDEPHAERVRQGMGRELASGLRAVVRHPLLRAFVGYAATRSFFGNFIGALYALYALRTLGLGPVLLGLTIAIGGASNLLGTLLVEPVTRRFGIGPTIMTALLVASPTGFFVPLARGPVPLAFGLLALSQAFDVIHPIYEVNALSVRQSITPPHLLGRVNATMQALEGALTGLGAIAGGLLGSYIGVRPTLFVAMLGMMVSMLWLLYSPLRSVRTLPALTPEVGGPVH